MSQNNNEARIAVLIPCYNEAATIGKVVRDFGKALPKAEIYVYDNNSTDGTAELAFEAGAIVRYERRQGKGNVIRTMFREIDADCYLVADGDDQCPADLAGLMCREVIDNSVDMVQGDRMSTTYKSLNSRRFHSFGNTIIKSFVNHFFKANLHDIMCGYRAFSPLFVKTFPVLSKGFEIETEMTIHALDKNLRIVEMPIEYRARIDGSTSKVNTFSDGFRVLATILKLYKDYRPLPFFSFVALLFTIAALSFFAPAWLEYVAKHAVRNTVGTLIISGFAAFAALLSMSVGMVLDTVRKNARQDFERWANLFYKERK